MPQPWVSASMNRHAKKTTTSVNVHSMTSNNSLDFMFRSTYWKQCMASDQHERNAF